MGTRRISANEKRLCGFELIVVSKRSEKLVLELPILQTLRLKGRAAAKDIATAAGTTEADVEKVLNDLSAEEKVQPAGRLGVKLTDTGRARLTALLAEERGSADQKLLAECYEEFCTLNSRFKALVSKWQMVDDDTPNEHDDPDYDAQIVSELQEIHPEIREVLTTVSTQLPRLAQYDDRLDQALVKVVNGDRAWISKPLVDSYHTVWFELHEELIGASGLSRVDEAAAGRAS